MSSKKSVLVFIDSDLSRSPRAQVMISALKDACHVTVAAPARDGYNGYAFEELVTVRDRKKSFHLSYPWVFRKMVSGWIIFSEKISYLYPRYFFEKKIWDGTSQLRLQQFSEKKFDVIICHHAHNLPVAARLARKTGAVLMFNAHEYYPREFEDNKVWVKSIQPSIRYICRTYLKGVRKCFSVSPGISKEYQKNYGLDCTTIPCVKPYYAIEPKAPGEKIRLIHQGYANRDRRIESMIEMCDYLEPRFELSLVLIPSPADHAYYEELKQMVAKRSNIRLIEPIKPEKLIETINQFDIGLYILEPTNFNTRHMLPNKLFEFVQARLMVAISPAEDMMHYVKKYHLGVIADDHAPQSMARKLNALSNDEIMAYKQNAHKAAFDMSAEAFYPLIREEVLKFI